MEIRDDGRVTGERRARPAIVRAANEPRGRASSRPRTGTPETLAGSTAATMDTRVRADIEKILWLDRLAFSSKKVLG